MHARQVADWIRVHEAAIIAPNELPTAFHAYLCTLPWAGAGIDWRNISHVSFSLNRASDDQVLAWARQTGAGMHGYVLLIDSATSPGIVCRFEDGVRDFDALSGRPELYMCGLDLVGAHRQPSFEHFIEIRSFTTLNAPRLPAQHS